MKTFRLDDVRGQRYLARVLARSETLLDDGLLGRVRAVADEIRKRGDAALLKHIRARDLDRMSGREIRIGAPTGPAEAELGDELRQALDAAIDSARRYHRGQLPEGTRHDSEGSFAALEVRPVPSVGIVLGGADGMPLTSLVMAVVPARFAGVGRIAVAISPRLWLGRPEARYLLDRLEVDEVYLMSGCHAAAAFALGTESVAAVELLVTGGDLETLAAGMVVSRYVSVRSCGGPPELAVVADAGADPALVAADVLAQLERDANALAVVVTPSAKLASAVASRVRSRARRLHRGHPAREALKRWAGALVVADLEVACEIVNRIAPSRAEVLVEDPDRVLASLHHVALVCVGPWTAPALVDEVSGTTGLLPTLGRAAARGPLVTWDFCRLQAVVGIAAANYPKQAWTATTLAAAEELPLHAASLREGCRGEG
jgi:histidinol dehydrogenase